MASGSTAMLMDSSRARGGTAFLDFTYSCQASAEHFQQCAKFLPLRTSPPSETAPDLADFQSRHGEAPRFAGKGQGNCTWSMPVGRYEGRLAGRLRASSQEVEGWLQLAQEQPAEQPRQHAHRQEETGATSDPAGAVKRGPAAGNDAMDVRMMVQGLAPGVENHGHAELGAKMPGIGRDGGERLGGDTEQDRIDGSLILEGDLADRRR